MCFTGNVPSKKSLHCANIFLLRMQLCNHEDTQPVNRFKRLKGCLECCKCERMRFHCAFAHLRGGNIVYGVLKTIGVGAGKLLGVRRIFSRISPNVLAKYFGPLFVRIFSETGLRVILGAIFARIFREFAQILMDFAKVFTDFA